MIVVNSVLQLKLIKTNKLLYNTNLQVAEELSILVAQIEKQLEAAGEGTSGQTELSRSKLENDFFIPYVVSINEQKKISHILNNIFENIFILKNLLKKTIDNLEALKLSFLNKEINNQKA